MLTRPTETSKVFAKLWRERAGSDAPVTIAPVFEIHPVPHIAPNGIPIFTSSHAVPLVQQEGRLSCAWCVGARTAEAALAQGYSPKTALGTADDLVAKILASEDPGPFIHFRGQETRGQVAKRLNAAGRSCQEIIVYAQKTVALNTQSQNLLNTAGPILLPLFSPRSAERVSDALKNIPVKANIYLVALSHNVADAWSGPKPDRMKIAQTTDAVSMLDALQDIMTS